MENGWWHAGLRYGLFGYVVRLWNIVFVLWSDVVNWCSIVVHFVLLFRFSQCKTEWYTPLCWLKVEGWHLKVSKKFLFRENWIFLNELSDDTEYAILRGLVERTLRYRTPRWGYRTRRWRYRLWAIGERLKARGGGYLFLMVSNPCPKTPLTLAWLTKALGSMDLMIWKIIWLSCLRAKTVTTRIGCWLYHPVPSKTVTPRWTVWLIAVAISAYLVEKMKNCTDWRRRAMTQSSATV